MQSARYDSNCQCADLAVSEPNLCAWKSAKHLMRGGDKPVSYFIKSCIIQSNKIRKYSMCIYGFCFLINKEE